MITRAEGFAATYSTGPDSWIGRSGKAGWLPTEPQFYALAGETPFGASQTMPPIQLAMRKPRMMMDPTDASTWQREYRFPPA